MKIRKLLLCLMILLPTYSFSQTTSTITITPEQLKTTNLIFLEHEKYTKEVPLLNKKIETLEEINKSWLHTDSIRRINEKQSIHLELDYYRFLLQLLLLYLNYHRLQIYKKR